MKPLIVLLVSFLSALLVLKFVNGFWDPALAGNCAMSLMLVFTAIGHFAYTKGMEMMLPPFVPFKKTMVLFTGVVEIAAAAGLLIPSLRHITSLLLILFFILILPCNIYAALKEVDYQKGTHTGPGKSYLWFRVPLQLFFIAWTFFFNL